MTVGLTSFLIFVSLIMLGVVNNIAHAYETPVTIEVPTSCSLTTGGGNYAISPLNGTTTTVNGNNVTVSCNDASGYAIYAIGFSGDLYDGNYHTDLIASLGNSYNIKTDGSGTYGSNWKMKITPVSNVTAANSYGSFQNIPASYTKVAEYNSSTTAGVFTPAYQVYISGSQPAGTYTGQVKYTLVHPSTAAAPVPPLAANDCPAGYVCYAPNSSDIEGSMATISNNAITSSPKAGKISVGQSASATPTLIAPNYKRSGYGFAGWSTDYEATNASTIYGPNETITVDLSSSGLILYPVWVANAGNLQGWTGCSSLTTAPTNTRATLSSITALTDTRDNNTYAVARLADSKCWMVENLRLDNSAIITVDNTNNPLHDANNDVILKTDYTAGTTAAHLAASNSGTWCTGSNAACNDQTMLNTNNTRLSDSSLTASYNSDNAISKWYSYGNYYNWYSATAGNGTYGFGVSNNSVTGDICPLGWRLPTGGLAYAEGSTSDLNVTNSPSTYRDYYNLGYVLVGTTAYEINPNSGFSAYDGSSYSIIFRSFPNNFICSGYWSGDQANGRGYSGDYSKYWTSTVNGPYGYSYVLSFHSGVVYPGTTADGKHEGASVRCVAGS